MDPGRYDPWELERAAARSSFRRRARWWVDVPFVVGALGLAALFAWIVSARFGSLSAWADTALVLLLIPALVAALVGFVILGALVYLLARLLGWLPGRGEPIRARLGMISEGARRGSDAVARTLIVPTATGSALLKGWRWLWQRRRED
jgi:hypothetical protein